MRIVFMSGKAWLKPATILLHEPEVTPVAWIDQDHARQHANRAPGALNVSETLFQLVLGR